jgi:hypothetical protein
MPTLLFSSLWGIYLFYGDVALMGILILAAMSKPGQRFVARQKLKMNQSSDKTPKI